MPNFLIREKSAGTLVGMAVGDALGSPAEGKTKEESHNEFGYLDRYHESFDLPKFAETSLDMESRLRESQILRWRPPGTYTDDTQQALAICDCLLLDKDLLGEHLSVVFCQLAEPRSRDFRFGVFRGVGKSFRDSIRALQDGVDWKQSGQDSASNGAAMRVAPLGIYLRNDLDKLKQRVVDQSIITHRDAMAIAAAQAIAHSVALLLPSRSFPSAPDFLRQVLEHTRAGEKLAAELYPDLVSHIGERQHGFSDALARVTDYLDLSLEEGIARIGEYAEAKSERSGIGGTGGYVLASVVSSIYIFAKHPGSYERAVLAAINHGGDTDTMGALTGAIAGALHGIYSIPARWIAGLKNSEQIRLRGEALAEDLGWQEKLRPLISMEEWVCNLIAEEQKPFLPRQQPDEPPPQSPPPPPPRSEEGAEEESLPPAEEQEERYPREGPGERYPREGSGDRYSRGGGGRGSGGGRYDRGGRRDRPPRRDDRRPGPRRGGGDRDRGRRGR